MFYEKAEVKLDRAVMEFKSGMRSMGESGVRHKIMPPPGKPEISLPSALTKAARAPRILAADDQQHILDALELLLKPQGYNVDAVRSPALAREALATAHYDAVLIDLNYTRDTTSGREGLDFLSEIVAQESTLPVIVMTAWGNVELAVEAMRRGARDFIQKPWENERLLAIVRTQVELHRALEEAQRLGAENRLLNAQGRPVFIASSPSMIPVLETITRIGPSDANVLITGEHGTGKEIVARTIHAVSLRNSRPLIAVNTGGLAEGVFESELFGHVKGAFTDARTDRIGRFELADGGTIFLDEIGNVPLRQQAKLLRVIEFGEMERVGSARSKKIDVRVISATNTDLRAACQAGQFREDLLFRLNTVEVPLPPLRERREDIAALAAHFLSEYASRYRRPIKGMEPTALQALLQYAWPGNVRELEHTMERAVLMCRTEQIQLGDLGLGSQRGQTQNLEELSLEAVEGILIRKALQRFQGNVSQAAEALGLSRGALYRRMEKYGL
jgi:DNA-binding NtrC family response regulator